MALLRGIFSIRGALETDALRPMLRDFADKGRRTLQRHDYPGALFASASPGSRHTVFSAPAASGALAGVVGKLNGQPRPAQVAQQRLADDGDAMLAAAEGAFAAFRYDPVSHTLRVANDKFGMRPFFLASSGDLLAFCSEFQPLLGLPGLHAVLDHDAVAEYFALGPTLGDKTLV